MRPVSSTRASTETYAARSTSTKEKKLTSPPSRRSFAKRSSSTVLASRNLRRKRSPKGFRPQLADWGELACRHRPSGVQDVRVSLAQVGFEAERFPEQDASGGSVYGYQPAGVGCLLKQRGRQLAADTAPPEPRADVVTPHAQCARHNRLDRQTSDSGEHATQAR